jgi:hypothetical protein
VTNAESESTAAASGSDSRHLARQATTANGLLLLGAAIMALMPATETWGVSLSVFLSLSLLFSGTTGYCGWLRILPMMPWNATDRRR